MFKKAILLLLVFFVIGCGKPKDEVEFQGVAEENDYIKQGMMFLQQKNVEEAIRSFDQAIKMDPQNPEKYITLGQVYLALKNYTRAIDTLSAATNVGPMEGNAHYLLAVSLRLRAQAGDYERAVESTKRSIICFEKSRDEEGYVRALSLYKSLMEEGQGEDPSEEPLAEIEGVSFE